jgi:lycopene beta-cyclase
MDREQHKYLLVGGGLQNALLSLFLLERHPQNSLTVVERGRRLGGNHTWCFHEDDVPPALRLLVDPLVVHRWNAYAVVFPGQHRVLTGQYSAVTSDRLAEIAESRLEAHPRAQLLTEVEATDVGPHSVRLKDGRVLTGDLVIDARGPDQLALGKVTGFQKFVGLELELGSPHTLTMPTLMDACVPQTDGFRFFYVLPLAPRRVLIEDTYFSDTPSLDSARLQSEILAYADQRSLDVMSIVRREQGVLPLPTREPVLSQRSPLRAGYSGGWFHPATGYSFPLAVRLADYVSSRPADQVFGASWPPFVTEHRRQLRFAVLLNRLLFNAFPPERRWQALARFYSLPAATIGRFYALSTNASDRLRILCGRPPRGISIKFAMTKRMTAA